MNEHLMNAQEAQKNYDQSLSLTNLEKYKEEYESEKESYDKYRTSNNKLAKTSAIIIPTAIIITTGLFILSKKIIKPSYAETAPLLTLNSINFNSDYQSTFSVAVALTIKN